MPSQNQSTKNTKVESCAEETEEDDSGAYAVFTEQGSSASQLTAAKEMEVFATLPGVGGTISLHPGEDGGRSKFAKKI